ncbi:MAG TPA: tRNA glutamyl-Q(34) synthetase GluQRS [Steroidobacteraceae bacterium]|nr:tRNA glutamyl-Q(34) synthetase GluQRS [Steroidobacteraceae bacterium]
MKLRSGANAAKSSTATATTGTAEVPGAGRYVGRFAPSPTGELHLGSLYTAAASYLDARAHGGHWLLRVEDLDPPRVVPGSADGILRTLNRFGFEWDGEVVRQGERTDRYAAALDRLHARGLTFQCSCSRLRSAEDERYPGHCRNGPLRPGSPCSTRVRVDQAVIQFKDRIQGVFRQDVAAAVGDILVRRRDQLFAYVLAVVVDDAAQGVTHVVRGADLLDNTPRQIHLQRLLGLAAPDYAHVPLLTESDGRKLAKSSRSVQLDGGTPLPLIIKVFELLDLSPPPEIEEATIPEAWKWATARWNIDRVPKRLASRLEPA